MQAVPGGQRVLEVTVAEAGARLDAFLARRLGVSRAEARRLLGAGVVGAGGRPLGLRHKGTSVVAGARLEVARFVPPEARRPLPQAELPLRVLAEGRGWLVLHKPPGVPVHPLREGEAGTLLNALLARHPEAAGVGEGGLRSGVVHRLDVDTSGAVLFATDPAVWLRLRSAFREHRVQKVYQALVAGRLEGEGCEELDLVVARHRPARVRVGAAGERGARRAELRWRVLEERPHASRIEVVPRTGFLHQIRAILAHRGHPLLGDSLYAGSGSAAAAAAPRHMLHAVRLALDEVVGESPIPSDFEEAWRRVCGRAW